uniref:Ribosomal protein S7 n=1 Tax=Lophophytum leandri TaxID=1618140 RepID=A0A8E7IWU5_9MAGN|nr:ribosomal protein S7 [Lophophytum leandri]
MYIKYDPIFNNELINILIKLIIKNGKNSLSYKITYGIMNKIKNKTIINPIYILYQVIYIIEPYITFKSKYSKYLLNNNKYIYKIPVEIKSIKRKKFSIRRLLKLSKKYSNKNIILKFSFYLFNFFKKKRVKYSIINK